jgi:hypothetical protein
MRSLGLQLSDRAPAHIPEGFCGRLGGRLVVEGGATTDAEVTGLARARRSDDCR